MNSHPDRQTHTEIPPINAMELATFPLTFEDSMLTIRPLRVNDDGEVEQALSLMYACEDHVYGGHVEFTMEQFRSMVASTPYFSRADAVAELSTLEGGTMIVGLATMSFPLQEDFENQYLKLSVHPSFRSHGIGRALASFMQEYIARVGRPKVSAFAEFPAHVDISAQDLPARALARRLGLQVANTAHMRALTMPVSNELLDAIAAEIAPFTEGYRIVTWEGGVPEEYLEAWCVMLCQLDEDDPTEDYDYEAPAHTPERVRFAEKRVAERGYSRLCAIAIAPDGQIAGNSYIDFRPDHSSLAWQENTLVMPEHRGHRLGLALKIATHREVGGLAPNLRTLVTGNSHINSQMIQINDRLGYTVVARELAFQSKDAPSA